MNNIFHEGEYQIQETMGVRKDSDALSSMIQNKLPFIAKGFLRELKFSVLTLVINETDMHSAVTYNHNNFIEILDDTAILINLNNKSHIPKKYLEKDDLKIGFLGIDFEQAMRIRINGKAKILDNKIIVSIDEAYANCPKYIKRRILNQNENNDLYKNVYKHVIKQNRITEELSNVISNSDTFFLASSHKRKGADISHKGGKKGFVKVISQTEIQFIDMPGNNLYNSLGNITTNSLVNLLFVDFKNNDIYLIIGDANITEVFEKNKRMLKITVKYSNIIKSTNSFLMNFDS